MKRQVITISYIEARHSRLLSEDVGSIRELYGVPSQLKYSSVRIDGDMEATIITFRDKPFKRGHKLDSSH